MRKIGLIANVSKPGAGELARQLADALTQRGLAVLFENETAAITGGTVGGTVAALARDCALLVALGGDGTILQVLHGIDGPPPPVLGVNLGTFGFLTTVGAADWPRAVEAIAAGGYVLSERTLLAAEFIGAGGSRLVGIALNDAVIGRGELSRLIRLGVCIDGVPLTEYNADGLIVATPTGSTAYSLSAGGPVLAPDSRSLVITPICPHVLTMRPLAVSDSAVIEISVPPGQVGAFLTLDGQRSLALSPGELVRLRRAEHRLPLAMLPGATFFGTLREKLKWSGSAV